MLGLSVKKTSTVESLKTKTASTLLLYKGCKEKSSLLELVYSEDKKKGCGKYVLEVIELL